MNTSEAEACGPTASGMEIDGDESSIENALQVGQSLVADYASSSSTGASKAPSMGERSPVNDDINDTNNVPNVIYGDNAHFEQKEKPEVEQDTSVDDDTPINVDDISISADDTANIDESLRLDKDEKSLHDISCNTTEAVKDNLTVLDEIDCSKLPSDMMSSPNEIPDAVGENEESDVDIINIDDQESGVGTTNPQIYSDLILRSNQISNLESSVGEVAVDNEESDGDIIVDVEACDDQDSTRAVIYSTPAESSSFNLEKPSTDCGSPSNAAQESDVDIEGSPLSVEKSSLIDQDKPSPQNSTKSSIIEVISPHSPAPSPNSFNSGPSESVSKAEDEDFHSTTSVIERDTLIVTDDLVGQTSPSHSKTSTCISGNAAVSNIQEPESLRMDSSPVDEIVTTLDSPSFETKEDDKSNSINTSCEIVETSNLSQIVDDSPHVSPALNFSETLDADVMTEDSAEDQLLSSPMRPQESSIINIHMKSPSEVTEYEPTTLTGPTESSLTIPQSHQLSSKETTVIPEPSLSIPQSQQLSPKESPDFTEPPHTSSESQQLSPQETPDFTEPSQTTSQTHQLSPKEIPSITVPPPTIPQSHQLFSVDNFVSSDSLSTISQFHQVSSKDISTVSTETSSTIVQPSPASTQRDIVTQPQAIVISIPTSTRSFAERPSDSDAISVTQPMTSKLDDADLFTPPLASPVKKRTHTTAFSDSDAPKESPKRQRNRNASEADSDTGSVASQDKSWRVEDTETTHLNTVQSREQARKLEGRKLMALIAHFDEEQLSRFEDYRRSSFNKPAVRRLMQSTASCSISQNVVIAMAGISKVFVGEIIEEALSFKEMLGEEGALQPKHVREAVRRLRDKDLILHGKPTKKPFL